MIYPLQMFERSKLFLDSVTTTDDLFPILSRLHNLFMTELKREFSETG